NELVEKKLIKKAEIILSNDNDKLDLNGLDNLTELILENYSPNSFKLYLEGDDGSLELNLDNFSGAIALDLINCSWTINLSLSVHSPLTNLTLNNCDNLAVLDIEGCPNLKELNLNLEPRSSARRLEDVQIRIKFLVKLIEELEEILPSNKSIVDRKKIEQIEELEGQRKKLDKEFNQIVEDRLNTTFQFNDYFKQFVTGGLILVIFYSFLYYFDDLIERELRVRGGHYSKNVLLEKFRGLPLEEKQRYKDQKVSRNERIYKKKLTAEWAMRKKEISKAVLIESMGLTSQFRAQHQKIIRHYTDYQTSQERINKFLTLPEKNDNLLENYNRSFTNREINQLSGKNGTGKTTLLYLVLGILTPEKGEIVITTEKGEEEKENYVLHRDLNLQR
ncbi:13750_t:CDS:2, partial [Racocetra fulgida]